MKRLLSILGVTLGLSLGLGTTPAHAGSYGYSGYQPWLNPLGYCTSYCKTPEEKRLQKFWHDYYHALKCYYGSLEHLDWVGYYKNHGYQINAGCNMGGCGMGGYGGACGPAGCGGPAGYGPAGCGAPGGATGCNLGPVNYAPVFVSPTMQWAIPNCGMNGPPVCPTGYSEGCAAGGPAGCPGH